MRTTLEIDDAVIEAAKMLAKEQKLTLGQVVSRLAQQALSKESKAGTVRNGVPLFTSTNSPKRADLTLVNSLRDGE